MIKIIRMVKRKPGMSLEEFKSYWLKNHTKLELGIVPKGPIKKIVASFATGDTVPRGHEPPYDGMVEMYFDSIEDFESGAKIYGDALRIDEENFIGDDRSKIVRNVMEEYLIFDRTQSTGPVGLLVNPPESK